MMERLRNRDLRTNNNKCYTMYFDDDQNKDITNSSKTSTAMPLKKIKAKSPRKREPVKSVAKPASASLSDDSNSATVIADVAANNDSGVLDFTVAKCVKKSVNEDDNDVDTSNKCDDASSANANAKNSIDAHQEAEATTEQCSESMTPAPTPAQNERKRRLSMCRGNDDDDDDERDDGEDGDVGINDPNCSTFASSSSSGGGDGGGNKKLKMEFSREQMFQNYQPWVIKTYGDLAKTKTITVKKHQRILKALGGHEQNNPDSSKFRFWVKAKGFTIEKPANFKEVPVFEQQQGSSASTGESHGDIATHLYVPNLTKEIGIQPYRKVAVVEQFFDIIYNVHVGLGGRSGRHAGQKRTYRTITESYAFLPRDAVTKFLAGCHICKKSPRACSPSRLDDTYCTESSSEMDILNYSPKSLSDLSAGSSTPLSQIQCPETSTTQSIVEPHIDMKPLVSTAPNEAPNAMATTSAPVTSTSSNNEAAYVDEIYTKISEYYRGIFSNIDLKDPNINADVLNYYQLIRQFYEQTMAANIQRNKTAGFSAATLAMTTSDATKGTVADVSTIDLTISKPTPIAPFVGDGGGGVNINESFRNNININIENNDINGGAVQPTTAKMKAANSNAKQPIDAHTENKVTISSAGVSINVSSLNTNSLKISCKTTPPKKRYSIYNHPNDAADQPPNKTAAINLNTKFNAMRHENGTDNATHSTPTNNSAAIDAMRTKASPIGRAGDSGSGSAGSITDIIPITSTYLQLMRSMGFSEEDAMKFDNVEPITTVNEGQSEAQHIEDTYAGLIKDADKLKLMLLAWNYQNSNAVRNGTDAPDMSMVGGLWAQYQNALAINTAGVKLPSSASPPQTEQSLNSPSIENPDESSSSGQKEDDDASEDDSDDRLDQNAHDPERLKAFNMFVRLFVDENLDRMIPISKQPKEKIQAIIDSCTRQFPEFSERARKRIRTYLKSCRRNKKTREGWEPTASRPTPAHLTSVQAEQILAMACENESMNAKRMRIGLDPISQTAPLANANNTNEATSSSISYPLGFKTEPDALQQTVAASTTPKLTLTPNSADTKPLLLGLASNLTNGNAGLNNTSLYRQDINSSVFTSRAQQYQNYFTNSIPTSTTAVTNSSPTDLSMKQSSPASHIASQPSIQLQQQQQQQQQQISQPLQSSLGQQPSNLQTPSMQQASNMQLVGQPQQQQPQRPSIISHKLNPSEISAVRQLVTGYRESAAFLLRSADELETLLLNQN